MAAALPSQPRQAHPVEISLDHDGASHALDWWLRTQETNGEPGDGSPEFFEYLEEIGRTFPDAVVQPEPEDTLETQPPDGGQSSAHIDQPSKNQ